MDSRSPMTVEQQQIVSGNICSTRSTNREALFLYFQGQTTSLFPPLATSTNDGGTRSTSYLRTKERQRRTSGDPILSELGLGFSPQPRHKEKPACYEEGRLTRIKVIRIWSTSFFINRIRCIQLQKDLHETFNSDCLQSIK